MNDTHRVTMSLRFNMRSSFDYWRSITTTQRIPYGVPSFSVRVRDLQAARFDDTTPRQNPRRQSDSVAGFPAGIRSSCTLMFSMQKLFSLEFGRSRQPARQHSCSPRQEGAHERNHAKCCTIMLARAIPADGRGAMEKAPPVTDPHASTKVLVWR